MKARYIENAPSLISVIKFHQFDGVVTYSFFVIFPPLFIKYVGFK